MSERAYQYRKGQPSELIKIPAAVLAEEQAARGTLVETLADHDDALLEKVLEDIKPTPDELFRDMHKDLLAGTVIEVMLGCAESAGGVRRLWKALRHDTPEAARDRRPQGDRGNGPRAGAGIQDRLCRPHRQAVLCPHLARDDRRRRYAERHAARRDLSFRQRRADKGSGRETG